MKWFTRWILSHYRYSPIQKNVIGPSSTCFIAPPSGYLSLTLDLIALPSLATHAVHRRTDHAPTCAYLTLTPCGPLLTWLTDYSGYHILLFPARSTMQTRYRAVVDSLPARGAPTIRAAAPSPAPGLSDRTDIHMYELPEARQVIILFNVTLPWQSRVELKTNMYSSLKSMRTIPHSTSRYYRRSFARAPRPA